MAAKAHTMLQKYLDEITRSSQPDMQLMLKEGKNALQARFVAFFYRHNADSETMFFYKSDKGIDLINKEIVDGALRFFIDTIPSNNAEPELLNVEDIIDVRLRSFCSLAGIRNMALSKKMTAVGRVFIILVADFSQILSDEETALLKGMGSILALTAAQRHIDGQADQEREKYKALFNQSNSGLLMLHDQMIVESNPKSAQLFALEPKTLAGLTVEELLYHKSDLANELQKEELKTYIQQALSGNPVQFEWLCHKSDGSSFTAEIFLTRFMEDKSSNLFVVIRDISLRKAYENELILAREEAHEANRLKSTALASMSHEIRTPLNSIIGFSGLLLDPEVTPEEKETYSKLISVAGKGLSQLVSDIIDFSKLEIGQLSLYPEKFDLHLFLQDLKKTFLQDRFQRGKEHIDLRLVMPTDQPLLVETDPLRLRQVITNLVGNAFKFVDHGFVEFGYASVTATNILFYVKDTGVGIDRNKQEQIFTPYGQDDTTYHRNREGSGLGLSISKSFVELLGGKIWLDSEQDSGSTFYFTIPYFTHSQEGVPQNQSGSLFPVDLSGKKVLIADDIRENYLFLKELFKNTGAELLIAKNGAEALSLAHENGPVDLALIDVRMPKMDGMQLAQKLREDYPFMIIMALTAYPNESNKEEFFALGCNEYLHKPLDVSLLSRLLTAYFD